MICTSPYPIPLSHHAWRRAAQRGISAEVVSTLLMVADRHSHVGRGCTALTVTRRALRRLRRDGLPAVLVERLAGLTVILGTSGGAVTLYREDRASRTGRSGRPAPPPPDLDDDSIDDSVPRGYLPA
mgnify:CR=1 FL=1